MIEPIARIPLKETTINYKFILSSFIYLTMFFKKENDEILSFNICNEKLNFLWMKMLHLVQESENKKGCSQDLNPGP